MPAPGLFHELNRNPSRSDRLKLGVLFLGVFGLVAALQWRAEQPTRALAFAAAAVLLCLVALIPPAGRRLYVAWMALGLVLGTITRPLFMTLAYAVLFVPLSLVFRLLGRDALKRKRRAGVETYWEDYPEATDRSRYFRQY
jgi:fatty acid desaturase